MKRNSTFFLVLILLLVSGETFIQNNRYLPVNKKTQFITRLNVPLIDFVKRNSTPHESVLVFDWNYNINGSLGCYGIREAIVHEFHQPEYKDLIVDTFSRKAFKTATAPVLESPYTDFTSSFIQLLGVKYLIFRHEFKGENLPSYYQLVYNRVDGKVYKNTLYKRNKGIFFCRPKYFQPENKDQVIENIKSMDYQNNVYIEKRKGLNLNYQSDMTCSVQIVDYSPDKVIYKYRADSDGILTFPESFDEGWSVTVNGEKRKVLKTNLIFKGVAVKKGKGVIVFRYHVPLHYKILVLVGFVFLISLVSLYFIQRKSEKLK